MWKLLLGVGVVVVAGACLLQPETIESISDSFKAVRKGGMDKVRKNWNANTSSKKSRKLVTA